MVTRLDDKLSSSQKIILKRLKKLKIDDLWNSQLGRRWGEHSVVVSNFFESPERSNIKTAVRFASHLKVSLDELYGAFQDKVMEKHEAKMKKEREREEKEKKAKANGKAKKSKKNGKKRR